MLIADLFLRYRKRFRVAIFALLLITPSQSSKAPNGCPEVATAWAKNPSLDALVKEPNFLPNAVKCLVYLWYKGAELSAEAEDLALEHEKFQEEFDSLEQVLIQVKSFTVTYIVRQWKTGNTTEKLIEILDRSFTILKEWANLIRHNAKKCESGKAWSVLYGVLATGACAGAICTGNSGVYAIVCGVSIGTICFSCNTYTTKDETLKKSARLRQDVEDWRMEIAKYRAYLDIDKIKLEMY